MLVITRKTGERLYIGDDVIVTVLRTNGNQVRIGISAPKDVEVHREEVYRRIHGQDDLEIEAEVGCDENEIDFG